MSHSRKGQPESQPKTYIRLLNEEGPDILQADFTEVERRVAKSYGLDVDTLGDSAKRLVKKSLRFSELYGSYLTTVGGVKLDMEGSGLSCKEGNDPCGILAEQQKTTEKTEKLLEMITEAMKDDPDVRVYRVHDQIIVDSTKPLEWPVSPENDQGAQKSDSDRAVSKNKLYE